MGFPTSHKNQISESAAKTGPTVFHPYPRRLESLTVCTCHYKGIIFFLSYLKTLSVGLATVWTCSEDRHSPNWANQAAVNSHQSVSPWIIILPTLIAFSVHYILILYGEYWYRSLLEPLTSASSGSELGSKPYSEAYSIPGPAPSSPWSMGDEMRASDNSGPGGTVTKWHKLPSLPLMVLINVVSFSEFIVWERKDVLKSSGFVAELGLVMWNLLDLRVYLFIYLFIFIFHSNMPYYSYTSSQWPPWGQKKWPL